MCVVGQKRKAGEGEHLFFDALKLLESSIPNFSIAAISESVLRWGSALRAPFTVKPCIASKNKCSPSPAINYILDREGIRIAVFLP